MLAAPDSRCGRSRVDDRAGALRALHTRLLQDHSLQFEYAPLPVVKPWHEPKWLQALEHLIGQALNAMFPALKVLFWVGVGAAVLAVLFLIARELFGVRFNTRRKPAQRVAPVDWRPEAWKARALLEDADRLAAQGRYDEAARLLLHRGIDDIEQRRPKLVRPALTARDIAALEAVPANARAAFSRIALAVEASWFGARPLDADGFASCRRSYESFAFPEAWG